MEGDGEVSPPATISTPPRKFTSSDHSPAIPGDVFYDQSSMISPSKARAQAQRKHEVTLIDSWLETLFAPNPVAAHWQKWKTEISSSQADNVGSPAARSEGVLKALQDLQYANVAADNLGWLLHEARLEELEDLRAHGKHTQQLPAAKLLTEIHDSLSPAAQDALASLARSSVLLGSPDSLSTSNDSTVRSMLISQLASAIVSHTQATQLLEHHIALLGSLHSDMQHQLEALREGEESSTRTGDENETVGMSTGHLHAQTAQHNRETKQISQKINEYRDRIAQLERTLQNLLSVPPRREQQVTAAGSDGSKGLVTIEEVLAAKDRIEERQKRVENLEQRLTAFHGLPPDLDASRNEVRRATSELETLKGKRDELFQQIGGA